MNNKSAKKESDQKENKSTLFKFFDLLSIGLLSFFKDSQEAKNDDAKFKEMLSNMFLGFLLVAFCFLVWFLFQKF